jgi:hypothetical protein
VLETSSLERPLPNNTEAERSILGAILLDNTALKTTLEKLKPEDFFHDHHRRIFQQMTTLGETQQAIDLVTLTDQLHRAGELESSGGHAYISQLMDGVPHVTNIEHYVHIVKEKSLLRSLIYATHAIQQQALEAEEDSSVILGRATETLTGLATEAQTGKQSCMAVCTPEEWKALGGDAVDYFVYPFAARGLLTLLDGAAKSAGKTTLLLTGLAASLRHDLFLNRATQNVRVLYVTEENPRTFRMALARAGLADETRFHIMPFSSYAGKPWPQVARAIEAKCVELKIDWLVVDTFFAVAGLGGETENQAGAVDAAIAPLRGIVGRLDIALTLTRHTRKSGGPIGESGRGSTALTGAADSIVELKRHPGSLYPERRQLEITGRVESAFMEIELRDGLYIVAPEAQVDNSTDEADRVAIAIAENRTANLHDLGRITRVSKNRISALASSRGWHKEGNEWVQTPS